MRRYLQTYDLVVAPSFDLRAYLHIALMQAAQEAKTRQTYHSSAASFSFPHRSTGSHKTAAFVTSDKSIRGEGSDFGTGQRPGTNVDAQQSHSTGVSTIATSTDQGLELTPDAAGGSRVLAGQYARS